MLVLIKTLYVLINVAIGVYDFSFFRIPNLLLVALLVLYGLTAPFYIGIENIVYSIIVFSVMLVICFTLFYFKFIGGGDAKYLAVASLWAGTYWIFKFLLIVALVGGVLSLIYLLLKDHLGRLSDWVWIQFQKVENRYPFFKSIWFGSGTGPELGKRENIDSRMVPYGIAIGTGAIIIMMMTNNPLTL